MSSPNIQITLKLYALFRIVRHCSILFSRLVLLVSMCFATAAWAQVSIITFGDSITSGVDQDGARTRIICPPNGGTFTPPYACNGNGAKNKGGYQPSARSQLAAQGTTADLYNYGYAGEESDQLLGRINSVMAARPSEYVFIMVGINDVNEAGYSTATTVFNVSRIIDLVIANGRTAVLGTVTPWSGNSTYNTRIQQINDGIESYADSLSVAISENYDALIGNFSSLHSGDGLHIDLTKGGNTIMATQWVAGYNDAVAINNAKGSLPGVLLLLD